MVGRGLGVVQSYTSKGGLAYKALRLARKVADAVNIEYKILDTVESSGGAIDYTGGLTTLNSVPQGTADNQRIGDSLKVQNETMRYYITRNGADCDVRIMLIWDEQNQATSTSDILESTGGFLSVVSPKNYDLRFRSKVLYDKLHHVTSNDPIVNGECIMPINLHTQFNAASTTIRTGALKLLAVSNVVTTNLPKLFYHSRMSFTDN